MAHRRNQVGQEKISCSICLDLLKAPVTVPCGHSFCMICIKHHWDVEDVRKIYSCPQCRKTFAPRPVLGVNIMLADLVKGMKKTRLKAAPAEHHYAGPEDVACDVCSRRKLKAQKSCLQCRASFCGEHLQPHFQAAPLKKHKLVEPSKKLQENLCSRHNEVMSMFCRTDQQSICHLCSVDQHNGHDVLPVEAERKERERELEESRQNIHQRIQLREGDVKLLRREVKNINDSAERAIKKSEKIFTELIRLVEKRRSDVKHQVRSRQQTEVGRVRELQEKLQQEITELVEKDSELKKLFHVQDHNQFLQDYPVVSNLREPTDSSSITKSPLRYFDGVTAAISEMRDTLQDILRETKAAILNAATEVDDLPAEPEPKSRSDFLRYSQVIRLDPNTAHEWLVLSGRNRKVTLSSEPQPYSSHPDRFADHKQVLSTAGLTGRCYWEVEQRGGVCVAAAYNSISRAGGVPEGLFGRNDKSWALECLGNSYKFWYNDICTDVSGPLSSRVGVYLDHGAGLLSFYSVSETMTLLHRVQTTFTQPLHAGLLIFSVGSSAEVCELK